MSLVESHNNYLPDIQEAETWFDEEYEKYFASYFTETRETFTRMEDKERPITDKELEWVLSCLPMRLFQVSEALNKYRLSCEMIKLSIKKSRKKDADLESILDDELLLSAMNSVVSRVEGEISFSRELIMGAKKIWDSRRRTEESMPVSEKATLPEYKAYVK